MSLYCFHVSTFLIGTAKIHSKLGYETPSSRFEAQPVYLAARWRFVERSVNTSSVSVTSKLSELE